jgi:uncharacterized damage-inducible protein DinB
MATNVGELFRHTRWANERMLEACRNLGRAQLAQSVEGTYGELGRTLIHLVNGESFYLELLTGWEPPVQWEIAGPWPGIDVLLERASFTGGRLCEMADEADPAALVDRGDAQIPTSVVLVQAINHGTEHRAHAATILTQLGIEPPLVDGWTFGGFD